MNDDIVLVFISGDKNEYDGKTTICINQSINNSGDDIRLLDLNSKEDFDRFDMVLSSLKEEDLSISHCKVIKEIVKRTRKNIIPSYIIDKIASDNEVMLFNILAEMGNIVIQNTEYITIIYAPKLILDQQKEVLNNIRPYFVDKTISIKTVLDSMNDKYTRYYFDTADEMFDYINQKQY